MGGDTGIVQDSMASTAALIDEPLIYGQKGSENISVCIRRRLKVDREKVL